MMIFPSRETNVALLFSSPAAKAGSRGLPCGVHASHETGIADAAQVNISSRRHGEIAVGKSKVGVAGGGLCFEWFVLCAEFRHRQREPVRPQREVGFADLARLP